MFLPHPIGRVASMLAMPVVKSVVAIAINREAGQSPRPIRERSEEDGPNVLQGCLADDLGRPVSVGPTQRMVAPYGWSAKFPLRGRCCERLRR